MRPPAGRLAGLQDGRPAGGGHTGAAAAGAARLARTRRRRRGAARRRHLTLTGATPNGFRFAARPAAMWLVPGSRACIGSRAAGAVVPNREEVLLGDVRIPRRGLFAIVQTTLQPDGQAVAGSSRGCHLSG